jgi:signal transduction histidine kinase
MRLSVGTRWTLRYSLAMLATVIVLAVMVFDRVERRFQQDAKLLLELQVNEVVAALDRHADDPAAFDTWLDEKLVGVGPRLGLGVALYDAEGELRAAKGVLRIHPLPVTPEIAAVVEEEGFYPADLGRTYRHFVTAVPLRDGLLEVAIYGRPFTRRTDHIGRVFQIAIPSMLVLTLGCGWWLTRRSLAPISDITSTAQRITGSHLEEWIPTGGTGDELDRLAETLNGMMARIRHGVERSREFQTRLARELRTPLLGLQREIAALTEDEDLSNFARRRLERALEEAEVLAEAVHAMLRLAWSEGGLASSAAVAVPLGALVESAANNVGPAAERRHVALTIGPLVTDSVSGDPFWLHQLFDSALEAAVATLPEGGTVSVWADPPETPGRCRLRLRARASTDDVTVGKGELGPSATARLALAREIARAHGGSLAAEESDAGDVEYLLELPS